MTALGKECSAELLKVVRSPAFLIPTLLFPVLFYTVFGVLVAGGSVQQSTYTLATYGVFAAMGPALFGFGVGLSLEREKGWLDLKRVMPMPPSNYLIAKLVAALVSSVWALVLVYAAAIFLGGVALTTGQFVQLFIVHLAAVFPFGFIGLTLGLLLKGQAALAITNVINLGLALLGGLFLPLRFFPEIMQGMGQVLPSYHAAQMALSVTGSTDADALLSLVILAVFTVIFAIVALLSWGRQQR